MIAEPNLVCVTVGDASSQELCQLHRQLCMSTRVIACRDIAEAKSVLWDEPAVDWVVIWQPRFGSVTQVEVEELRQAAPIARLIEVAGVWCEGEPASGRPLQGVHRVYWHEFPWRLRSALKRRRSGALDQWSLPHTIDRVDRMLDRAQRCAVEGVWQEERVTVVADRQLDFEAVATWCRLAGARVRHVQPWNWSGPADDADIVIWNCGSARSADRLQTKADGFRGRHRVILLDFPRPDEVDAWQSIGWRVVARPFYGADLVLA